MGQDVSVVVTTYYRNDFLQTAIESALAQKPAPAEVIVVDGSGEAHARPVAEAYGVDYVAQERDEGPQAARSIGAERASGRYVQFLDDDDRLLQGKFRAQLPLFDEDTGVVYCGVRDEDYGDVTPESSVRGRVLRRALSLSTFPCIPSTMLVDREVLGTMLPLGHRHGADDSGMKVELALRTQFDFADEPLVVRGRPDGEELSESWAHVDGRHRIVATYAELYEEFPEARREALRGTYYRTAQKHLEEKPWSAEAVRNFTRAARHADGDEYRHLAAVGASLLGRPGIEAADPVLP